MTQKKQVLCGLRVLFLIFNCQTPELGDKGRKRNIRGAFAVQKNVKGENIVLIDDIYTTGSTLDEAARVLKKAGAENVYFLTVSIGQGI